MGNIRGIYHADTVCNEGLFGFSLLFWIFLCKFFLDCPELGGISARNRLFNGLDHGGPVFGDLAHHDSGTAGNREFFTLLGKEESAAAKAQ